MRIQEANINMDYAPNRTSGVKAPKASKQGNIYGYIWGKALTSMEFQDVDTSIPPVLFL